MMRMMRDEEEKRGLLDGDDTALWHDEQTTWANWYSDEPKSPLQKFLNNLTRIRKSISDRRAAAKAERPPMSRTAWLDGLRGFAAFMVFWHHHMLWTHCSFRDGEIFESAWGYKGRYYLATLPGIRTFFTGGHYSVSVFFIISGYVLTTKPLSLIQSGDFSKLADNLASALFRRWLRLHVPLMVTTFLFLTSWHVFGIWVNAQNPFPSYLEEVSHWITEYRYFSFVFGQGFSPWLSYNFHSWSIPVEMRGSIVVYTAVLAFARLEKNWRLAGQAALMVYFMCGADAWYLSLFVAGMTLSDLDLQALKDELPSFITRFEKRKTLVFWAMLAVGVYLGGVPAHSADATMLGIQPGWVWLSMLNPGTLYDYKWFYLFFASTLTVVSIQRLPIKAFFETDFCQYLGKISYALYLVHGPLLWTIGDRLYASVGWYGDAHKINIPQWVDKFPLSMAGPLGLEIAFLVPCVLIMLPLTLWIAEITTDLVDTPSVRLAQKLYARACGKPTGRPQL